MTETITTIIQWLIPSGSLATVIIWLTNKVIRNARTDKEVHDIYKKMYDEVKETLLTLTKSNKELRNEVIILTEANSQLQRAVCGLKRTLSKITKCQHYASCPIRDELRDEQKSDPFGSSKPRGKNRQRGEKEGNEPDTDFGTEVGGTGSDSDGEPP